jgi:hypothetical protein
MKAPERRRGASGDGGLCVSFQCFNEGGKALAEQATEFMGLKARQGQNRASARVRVTARVRVSYRLESQPLALPKLD